MNNRWDNLDDIFPDGGTYLDDVWYTNEQIRMLPDLPLITSYLMKPVRDMIEKEWTITWYDDGRMDFDQVYDVAPKNNVDDISLLSVYGCKMIGNYYEREKDYDENSPCTGFNYSSL